MKALDWRRWPLAVKLSVTMTALVVIAVIFFTLRSIRREQNTFRAELEEQALVILEPLERSVANPLLRLDTDTLQQLIENFGETRSGIIVRVYDADGRMIADTSEGSTLVFSTRPDPVGQEIIGSSAPIFQWHSDRVVAGQAVVSGRQRPGAVSISLPTSALEAKQNAVRDQGIVAALAAGLVGMLLSIGLSRTITQPLSELTVVTERIAGGDLTQRVTARHDDEFAKLATAFNKMADKLQLNIKDLENRAEELRIANHKAEEASRLKTEFLATMSHELRTPLNAILGFSGLLLMGIVGPLDDRVKDRVQRIESNGEHLLNLINNILDLSKIEAGRMELAPSQLELAKLVSEWKSRIEVLAQNKGLAFDVKLDAALPPTLYADKNRLTQIAFNLLSNAVKFTEKGKINLELKREGAFWIIQVSDTGTGIPPEAQEYIFDEFRQVDGSFTREHGGTGLGLAIVRKLCRTMGGTVSVDSKLGVGSTFTVRLPLEATPVAVPEPAVIAPQV